MTLDITKSADIIETMENCISRVRPPVEIRDQLDLEYEIADQSAILNEIHPAWNNPGEIRTYGYAKVPYGRIRNLFKTFLKRADQDQHGCFQG